MHLHKKQKNKNKIKISQKTNKQDLCVNQRFWR